MAHRAGKSTSGGTSTSASLPGSGSGGLGGGGGVRDRRCLGRVPELGQRARRGGRRLDGGGVRRGRDAEPAGAEPLGHLLLGGGGPGVVVLAVDDQYRQVQLGQFGGPVRGGEY